MRSVFRGFYPPDQEELSRLWDQGLIVLDTNALLNLFRYSNSTRNEFMAVLSAFENALWLPHQVGLEFQRRRLEVVQQQARAFDEVDGAIRSAANEVAKTLRKFERHPSLNANELSQLLDAQLAVVRDRVSEAKEQHKNSVVDSGDDERTFDAVTELYEGRVGEPFSAEDLRKLYAEGRIRYDAKIPPGYKDIDKPEPARYGDLVLWQQILKKGAETGRPLIFVTDDAKEDWWYQVSGKTRGPRVELVEEYFSHAGERAHFYAPERFLTFAKERSNSAVSDASLTEVEEVSSARYAAGAVSILRERQQQLQRERAHSERMLREYESSADREPEDIANELASLQSAASNLSELLSRARDDLSRVDAYIVDVGDDAEISDEVWQHRNLLKERARELQSDLARTTRQATALERGSRGLSPSRAEMYQRRLLRLEQQISEVESALEELGE